MQPSNAKGNAKSSAALNNPQPTASNNLSQDWKKTSFIDRAKLRPGDDTDIETLRRMQIYFYCFEN